MRIKYFLILCFAVSFLLTNTLSALKPEYTKVEEMYLRKDNTSFLNHLNELNPTSTDEKAFIAYYKAKMITNSNSMTAELIKVADSYSKSEYGQKGCLDLGIIYYLQRDLNKSSHYLNKITYTTIPEKDYWLAQIYLKQFENDQAILSGQTYLRTATDADKIETIYYIIANAYINQRKYESVQPLLTKLDNIKNLPKHKVYYHYLRGYAYDMMSNYELALEHYKRVYTLDRYSQYAFLTENRLFAMKGRKKNNLDISFIYPDSVYHPALELPDTSKTLTVVIPIPGVDPPLDIVPDSIQMVEKTGHGIFLQLGRFSSELNAQNLMLKLKDDNFNAYYFPSKQDGKISYRVLMGPYKTKALAEKMKTKLNDKTYGSIIVTR